MSGTRSPSTRARATDAPPSWASAALVLCAHGVRGGVGAAAGHAAAIRRRGLFAGVHASALKGAPGLAEAFAALDAPRAYVAPLLMAEGYTLRAIRRRLDAMGTPGREVVLCRPVGAHPRLAAMMTGAAGAACAARSWSPAETALLVVGHGTRRDPNSGATARRHAAGIAATGRFAETAVAFLDEPPAIPDALAGLAAPRCVAVGLFVDRGEHGEEDIPALLAPAGDRAAYAGPIGTDPAIAELILEQVGAAAGRPLAA